MLWLFRSQSSNYMLSLLVHFQSAPPWFDDFDRRSWLKAFKAGTYRAVAVRVVIRYEDFESENALLINALTNEDDTVPDWKWKCQNDQNAATNVKMTARNAKTKIERLKRKLFNFFGCQNLQREHFLRRQGVLTGDGENCSIARMFDCQNIWLPNCFF